MFVGAFVFEESLGVESPTGENLPLEQIVAMLQSYVASLPEDRFPLTQAAAEVLFSGDQEQSGALLTLQVLC